jgi:hypothetical protein
MVASPTRSPEKNRIAMKCVTAVSFSYKGITTVFGF